MTHTENSSVVANNRDIAVRIHFHLQHGTKTFPIVLPAHGEASWSLLKSLVALLSGGTMEPGNTYSCILKVTGQVWESQKRIRINTNYSLNQRSSSQASLNWFNNKIRFSFNQTNRKRWGARLVDVIKNLHHKIFLLGHYHYKGCQPRLKRHLLPITYDWPQTFFKDLF